MEIEWQPWKVSHIISDVIKGHTVAVMQFQDVIMLHLYIYIYTVKQEI